MSTPSRITDEQISCFRENGYLIIPNFFKEQSLIDDIKNEVVELGRVFSKEFDYAEAISHMSEFSAHDRHCFYNALRYLPALTQLSSSLELTSISRQLGLRVPAVMRSFNLRMDLPVETRHLFHWHQDITYLLGSFNSVTYWLPFDRVDAENGSIGIVPGSHVGGIRPFEYVGGGEPAAEHPMSPKEIRLISEPEPEEEVIVEAEACSLIVFSQFLLHRSTPNRGKRMRWTAQVRHSDFADPKFIEAKYPFGDQTNVLFNNYLQRK